MKTRIIAITITVIALIVLYLTYETTPGNKKMNCDCKCVEAK